MIKHIKINSVFYYVLLLVLFLSLPQTIFAACPGGLVPIHRTLGPICAYVYPLGANLPSGCTDPNDLNSFLCHPELHGSYQLPNGFYNQNSGWVQLVSGSFLWSGPGMQPSTPPPNITNRSTNTVDGDVYRTCEAADSINSGQIPLVLFSGGTSRPATQGELSAPTFASVVSACLAGTYYGGSGTGTTPPTPPAPPPAPPAPPPHGGGTGTTGGINPPGGITPPTTPPPPPPPAGTPQAYLKNSLDIISETLKSMLTNFNSIIQSSTSVNTHSPIVTTGSGTSGSSVITSAVAGLNIRISPVTVASVVHQIGIGDVFTAIGWVVGETVAGESRWWRTSSNEYVWAGGTVEKPY